MTAKALPSRTNGTMLWLKRTPRAAAWLATVLSLVKSGRSAAPGEAIRRALVERFDYPFGQGAFRIYMNRVRATW
jgi:hypothetical protein